jgi:hypothetical protein
MVCPGDFNKNLGGARNLIHKPSIGKTALTKKHGPGVDGLLSPCPKPCSNFAMSDSFVVVISIVSPFHFPLKTCEHVAVLGRIHF